MGFSYFVSTFSSNSFPDLSFPLVFIDITSSIVQCPEGNRVSYKQTEREKMRKREK